MTDDFDLFLPRDADNLVNAWASCEDAGLELWSGSEPLDQPHDRWLANRIVERRALTRVTGPNDLAVDLTLVMQGSTSRPSGTKDKLFLATHLDAPRHGHADRAAPADDACNQASFACNRPSFRVSGPS